MIKKVRTILALAVALCAFSSCLNGNDDEITYYDDTAISSFSLGTVNRFITTTASDGSDSVYTSSYDASSYDFYIDQLQAIIYNPDSLPTNTDAEHIVCSIGTKNGGVVVLELTSESGEDSLVYYSSSDSIDFSSPIKARVYNNYGTSYRTYTIKVNIHQEEGDEFSWSSNASTEDLSQMGDRKFVALGDSLFLYGTDGSTTIGYLLNGSSWEPITLTTTLGADAYKSMVTKDGYLYTLSGSNVMRSANGTSWSTVAQASQLELLLGSTPFKLYALGDDAIYSSEDNGASWTEDSIDDEASLLPTDNVNFISRQHRINDSTYQVFLIGTRDGTSSIWKKVEEDGANSENQPWAYYPSSDFNYYELPALDNLKVIDYDDALLALGGDFSTFYKSQDDGLTWFSDSTYTLPDTFGSTATKFSMVRDNSNYIFISKSADNNIWSGRLARMSWATEQKSFTE